MNDVATTAFYTRKSKSFEKKASKAQLFLMDFTF